MKSNHKIVQPRKASLMREFLWGVYKWSLVGLCVYFCYRMLHINSGIYSGELLACILITGCFFLIIKYHATLKKKAEQPDFHDDLSVLHDFITWVFYAGLYIYSIFSFASVFGKTLSIPHALFLVIIYLVVPFLYNFLFTTD